MLSLLLSLVTTPAHAADEPPELNIDLSDGPHGLGIGLAFGEPSGLSLAVRADRVRTLQGHVSWSLLKDRFRVGAEYLHNVAVIKPEQTPDTHFPLFVGVGAAVALDGDVWLGARAPLGLGVLPVTVPVDAWVQVAPTVWLLPEVRPDVEGTIGFRVWI